MCDIHVQAFVKLIQWIAYMYLYIEENMKRRTAGARLVQTHTLLVLITMNTGYAGQLRSTYKGIRSLQPGRSKMKNGKKLSNCVDAYLYLKTRTQRCSY